VVDCRRILKWTYAYGYYRFGENATSATGAVIPAEALRQQQEFFEFNQARKLAPQPVLYLTPPAVCAGSVDA
jgi:hypothetical protein